jgi:LAO/AO transport system kinase
MTNREEQLLSEVHKGNFRALARTISYVENGAGNFTHLLAGLPPSSTPVIGITGPPGAGKSTLADTLIEQFTAEGKKVAVLCVDPSSSIYFGALLGDRIRMNQWYDHPGVFIRSLSTRGTLGGLNPAIIEITDLLKYAGFDLIVIETVGVGQNEIEIAGLADTTLVVLAPEAGDDIQSMKAGLMEIADIFVVNKSDRPGADIFVRNLRSMRSAAFRRENRDIPIIKTIATQRQGIAQLTALIREDLQREKPPGSKYRILADKAYHLIQQQKMKGISRAKLAIKIGEAPDGVPFNLYRFIQEWL